MEIKIKVKKETKALVDKNVKSLTEKGFTKERALTILLYKVSQEYIDLYDGVKEVK